MWCSINKRNQSPPSWLNKSKPQFKFFALFSLCIPSPSVCMSLNPCLPEGCLVNLSVFVSLCVCVLNTRLLSAYIEQHRKLHMGKEWGIFCRVCNRVWQGIQLLSLTDPKNIIVNKMLCSVFVVDILWYCFQPVFLLSSPNVRVFMHYSGLGSWQGT